MSKGPHFIRLIIGFTILLIFIAMLIFILLGMYTQNNIFWVLDLLTSGILMIMGIVRSLLQSRSRQEQQVSMGE